jgi:hypothetical protein
VTKKKSYKHRRQDEKVKQLALAQNLKKSKLKSKSSSTSTKESPKSLPFVPGIKLSKPRLVKRVLTKRKCNPRSPYYDETDKKALKVIAFSPVII